MYPDNLLMIFSKAIRTVAGWTIVVMSCWLVGIWLGMSMHDGVFIPPGNALNVFVISPFLLGEYPLVGLAMMVTLAAWIVPLIFDSGRLYIGAGIVNLVAWTGIGAFVMLR